jgi:hypothetical protein
MHVNLTVAWAQRGHDRIYHPFYYQLKCPVISRDMKRNNSGAQWAKKNRAGAVHKILCQVYKFNCSLTQCCLLSLTPWNRITISLGHEPSWDFSRRLASPVISCILQNSPKVDYRIYNSPPAYHKLDQVCPPMTLYPTYLRFILNTVTSYTTRYPNWPFLKILRLKSDVLL